MLSTIITILLILGILIVFAFVIKMVKIGITLAIVIGIIALIWHFMKKKA